MPLQKQQAGTAIALVLWLLAAMSVTVAGAVSLSRDEVSLADDGLTSAKAFYLGKGAARLVMHDRWLAASREAAGEESEQAKAIFSRRYRIADADVDATVIPSAGFVSLVSSGFDTWRTTFTELGGMEPSAAARAAKQMVGSEAIDVGVKPANLTGFGAYKFKYGGGVGNIAHVESLLRVEGVTRDIYERLRGFIAPFSGPPRPHLLFAPVEIRSAFAGEATSDLAPAIGSGFCVQLRMDFGASRIYTQKIWVTIGAGGHAALDLVKIERPVPLGQVAVG